MGLFDLFKKKKNVVDINGVKVDLDQYYEENWRLFPSMVNGGELDYALIEHYARYYKDFEVQCLTKIKLIMDDIMDYSIDVDSLGVKLPIKLDNYVGKSDCIQQILADIKKCEDVIDKQAEVVIEERKKAEEKRQEKLKEQEEQERIIPAKKVELSDNTMNFIVKLRDYVEKFIATAKNRKNLNSKDSYSYNILADMSEETKNKTIDMVVSSAMGFEELVRESRNELIDKAALKSGYPKKYVSTVEEILYMINSYDGNEAFDYDDLDTVVMYVKMNPNDFKKVLVDWTSTIDKELAASAVSKK